MLLTISTARNRSRRMFCLMQASGLLLCACAAAQTTATPAPQPSANPTAQAATVTDPALAERVHRFLSGYIGTWEGTSRMQTTDGSFRNSLSVFLEYRWDKTNPQVLVGTAIFATGSHSAYTTSHTYLLNGRLVSAVTTNGKQQFFTGRIDEAGHSVFWQPMHAIAGETNHSQETFRETADGKRQMLMESVENYRGNKEIALQQQALLTRTGD